jgi:hypothetical protein
MAKRQKNRQHNGQKTEEQTTQWPKDRRTDNTMAKRQKNTQHNGQKTEEQTTQWPKDRRTDNTMAKRKKYKQRSTKHTYKTKDGVIRTPLSIGVNLGARSTINN